MARTKKEKAESHNRSCEIMAFGICTCDFWDEAEEKQELGINEASEKLATILAICREHKDGFDMLSYIERIILGKEQYVPPSRR